MAVERIHASLLQRSPAWVYTLLCEHEGLGFLKIGLSAKPLQRITQISHSIPFPVKYCGAYRVESRAEAEQLESRLHAEFRERKTRGEWFSFDFRSAQDKAEFRSGCKKYMNSWWETFPIGALNKLNDERMKSFFRKHGVKGAQDAERRRRAGVRSRRAHEELAAYGT